MPKLLSDDDVRERIRENMRTHGLNQKDYADIHGYSQSDLSLFLTGKVGCTPRIFVAEGLRRRVFYQGADE